MKYVASSPLDQLSQAQIESFHRKLISEEKSASTVSMYLRELRRFYLWLPQDKHMTRDRVLAYKAELQKSKKATSVNAALAALNSFFRFAALPSLLLKPLRTQRRVFCEESRELSYPEYLRLVETAEARDDQRLSLILQTIAGTGIRISELQAIAVEAIRLRFAEVSCKGKIRTVLLPGKLCKKLLRYVQQMRLTSGSVFVTRSGKTLNRSNIWAEMKKLCAKAGVDPRKVFPHNLRHLFARRYYGQHHDLSKLANILGHSNINTTRIYTISTGREHARQIEALGLVT